MTKRRLITKLPGVLQTPELKKFFSSTVDQVFQPGETQSVNAFIGKKPAYFNVSKDFYKPELTREREFYQLEPAMTTTLDGSISDLLFYQDTVNNLRFQGADVSNESRLFNTDFYSWCPPVNISKLERYRDYFWLPEGPPVLVFDILTGGDETLEYIGDDKRANFFIPNSIPGTKVRVQVTSNGVVVDPSKYDIVDGYVIMHIAPVQGTVITVRTLGGYLVTQDDNGKIFNSFQLPKIISASSIYKLVIKVNDEVIENGYILDGNVIDGNVVDGNLLPGRVDGNVLTNYKIINNAIVFDTPLNINDVVEVWVNGDFLDNIQGQEHYVHPVFATAYATEHVNEQYIDAQGNVATREIVKYYPEKVIPSPPDLSQDMRVKIIDNNGTIMYRVTRVDGKIMMVPEQETITLRIKTPQYITIERGAKNNNGWSLANKWFHKSTLVYADPSYQPSQAVRPIVEYFNSLLLLNNGVNLLDTVDAVYDQANGEKALAEMQNALIEFQTVQGKHITDGTKILVINSLDANYHNRILKVNEVVIQTPYDEQDNFDNSYWDGAELLNFNTLPEAHYLDQVKTSKPDTSTVDLVEYWFDGASWKKATTFNYQEPLFNLFDGIGKSLNDYQDSSFTGSKLFSYERSSETPDRVLQIPVVRNKYGLLEFRDHLATDVWTSDDVAIPGYKYFAQAKVVDGLVELEYRNNWHVAGTTKQDKVDGFYEIPKNLQANATSQEVEVISPNEWQTQFKALLKGSDWLLDSSAFNLSAGQSIIQSRGTMLKTMLLNADTTLDFTKAANYVEHEYIRYRNKFVQLLKQWEIQNNLVDVETGVLGILKQLKSAKTIDFPFYNNGVVGEYFIPATAAFLGMTPLWKPEMTLETGRNGSIILIRGHDGSVISGFTRIASKTAKLQGGVIVDGNDVISVDNKDLALWNLENKIYGSAMKELREQRRPVFDLTSYTSGKFRTAEYSHEEFKAISRPLFERWATKMNIDYRTNKNYDGANPFTYNYSDLQDIDGKAVPGFWRGMYLHYFDTDRPHTHPWEMLGFTSKPTWWDDHYAWDQGDSKRQALVTALTMGLVSRPGAIPVYDQAFARAGFDKVNPVALDGSLLDPLQAGIVVDKGVVNFAKDWAFGDVGPVEYQWMTSQSRSFTMAQLSYLTKPVHFVESTWETADEVEIHGYDWVSKATGKRKQIGDYKIHNELINGKAIRVPGLQLWLSDYLRSLGKDVTATLGDRVRALGANLAHKLGGFMDQSSLKAFTENSGLIPQEDVSILTYNSPSIREEFYGGVIVSWTGESWKVIGYDVTKQAFNVLPVDEAGAKTKVALDGYSETFATDWHMNTYYPVNVLVQWQGTNYRCNKTHTSGRQFEAEFWTAESQVNSASSSVVTYFLEHFTDVQTVPYGTEFYTHQEVVNFLSGYEAYLKSRGWDFEYLDSSINEIRDFKYSAKEFLSWSQVKWEANTFIALSPSAQSASFKTTHGTIQPVDQLINGTYALLGKEGSAIEKSKIAADRTDDGITVSVVDDAIYGLRLSINEVEQVIVFQNTTTFNDVIFQPLFDVRQNRIRMVALLSTGWTGKLDAPGFVITDNRLMPSFEKQVEDVRYMYDIEKTINLPLRDNARHQIGYQSRPYLENLMYNEVNQFEFYQGMIQQKGAPGVFEKLLRNDDLTQSQELSFLEEWAFLKGQYGGVSQDSTFEIELARQDIMAEPQMVKFTINSYYDLGDFDTDSLDGKPPVVPTNFKPDNIEFTDPSNDTVIEMENLAGKWDSRIIRPYQGSAPFTTAKKFARQTNDLPNAGYVRLQETDWQSMSLDSFETEIKASSRDLESGNRLWIYSNEQNRWSVFRMSESARVTAYYPDADGVKVVFDSVPSVKKNDVIYLNKVINKEAELGGFVKVKNDPVDNYIVIEGDVLAEHEYADTDLLPTMFRMTDMRARITNAGIAMLFMDDNKEKLSLSEVSTVLGINVPDSFQNGEAIYVDVGFEIQGAFVAAKPESKLWKTFKFDSLKNQFVVARTQPQRLRSDLIKDVKVYDTETTVTKTRLTVKPLLNGNVIVFDPCKGLLPGVADKEIWYKLEYDPASYNRGLGVTGQGADWGAAEVGRLWWNISAARFLQTETNDLDNESLSPYEFDAEMAYRRNNHGKLAPNTSVDVYEWVQSKLTPLEWMDKVAKGEQPELYDGVVLNAEEPTWVEDTMWDDKAGEFIPVYYFWVKDRAITPMAEFRSLPARDVAQIISNPEGAGVAWMAPINRDAFLVDGIAQYLNSTSSLEVRVARSDVEIARHVEWDLMRNGDERSLPTRELWNKIVKSLSTRTESGAILPDASRYYSDRIGFDVENGQILFSNVTNARKHLVQYLNKLFAGILLVDERRDISSLVQNDTGSSMDWYQKDNSYYVKPHPEASMYDATFESYEEFLEYVNKPGNASKVGLVYQNTNDHTFWSLLTGEWDAEQKKYKAVLWAFRQYTVASMAARDALIPSIKVGERVMVQGVAETGNFWTLWQLTAQKTFKLVATQRYNTLDIYSMVDWYAAGYTFKDEPTSVYETTLDRDQQLGIDPLITLVKINNDGKGRWMWTAYQDGRWHTVAKQNGTISLNDLVWSTTGNYMETDLTELPSNFKVAVSNRDMGYELAAFMNLLRDDILTAGELNNLFFTVIDYAHTEQNYIDWCFKTSFMYVTGYTERLLQDPIALSDRTGNLLSYINEVKPYHVKIRDFASKYGVSDNATVHATDFDFPAYFDPKINQFRQLDPKSLDDLLIIETGVWNHWWQQYQHNNNQLVRKLNVTRGHYNVYDSKTGELIVDQNHPEQFIDEVAKVRVTESVRLRVQRRGDVGAPTTSVKVVKSTGSMNVTMDLVAQTQSAIAAFADGLRVDPLLVTFDAAKSCVTANATGSKFEVQNFSYGSNGLIREIKYFTKSSTVRTFDLVYTDLTIEQLMVTVSGKEVTPTLVGSMLTVPTSAANGLVQVAILNESGKQFKRITTQRFIKSQFAGKTLSSLYPALVNADRLPVMNNFVIEVDGLRKMTEMIYNVNINAANPMIRIERDAPVNELLVTLDEKPVVVGTKLSRKLTILAAEREVNLFQHPQLKDLHVTDAQGNPIIVGEMRSTLVPIDQEHPELFPVGLSYDVDVYDDPYFTWDGTVIYGDAITWDNSEVELRNTFVNWESIPEGQSVFQVVPTNAKLALYEGHLIHMDRMYADMEIIVTIDNYMPKDFEHYQWVPANAPFVKVNDMISATNVNVRGNMIIVDKVGGELDLTKTIESQFPTANLVTITDIVDTDMGTRTYTFHNIEQPYFPINQLPANDAAVWVNLNGRRLTNKEDYEIIETEAIGWDDFVWELDGFEDDNYQMRGNVFRDDLDFDNGLVWGDAVDEYDNGPVTTLAIKLLFDPAPNDLLVATVFAEKQATAAREYEIFMRDKKPGKEVREITEADRYSLVQAITNTSTSVKVVQRPGPYTRDAITAADFDGQLWVEKDLLKVNSVNNGTVAVTRNAFVTASVGHTVLAKADAPQLRPAINDKSGNL
jgi:hypothetical protein